jgi:FkbM family methyltransferase
MRNLGHKLKLAVLDVARLSVVTALLELLTFRRGVVVLCAGHWPLRIPWRRRLELNFVHWEREFVDAYLRTVCPSDIVYDIGTENGEWAALVGTKIGGSRLHLFEPNGGAWGAVKRLWELNGLDDPAGCWRGFVGDKSTVELSQGVLQGWPMLDDTVAQRFESLREPRGIGTITIDDYVASGGTPPTVIKMDIEGAEVLACKGAERTIREHRPVVFLSYHPWLVGQFGAAENDLHDDFEALGYKRRLLGCDHEEHWVLWHPKARLPAS